MHPTNANCEHRSPVQRNLLAGCSVEIGDPVLHQDAPALKEIRAGAGRRDLVPDHVRQDCLDHLAWMIRFLDRRERGRSEGEPERSVPLSAVDSWLTSIPRS